MTQAPAHVQTQIQEQMAAALKLTVVPTPISSEQEEGRVPRRGESLLATQFVPDDDRVVIIVESSQPGYDVMGTTVRYRNGKWYGTTTGSDLGFLTSTARWLECPYQNAKKQTIK